MAYSRAPGTEPPPAGHTGREPVPAAVAPRGRRAYAWRVALALAAVVALATLPYWDRDDMRLATEMATYLALAQLWNLLAGYAGLVSIGQQAFVGLGGYALVILTGAFGVHPLVAIALAGLATGLLSVPIAAVVFRLRGAQFAVGTWVVAEVCELLIAQSRSLGAGSGQSLLPATVREIAADRPTRDLIMYWGSAGVALGVLAFVYVLLRSRHGLALTAIRDSERASRSIGIDTARTKLFTFVVVAFCTGIVGAIIFLQKLRISPPSGFSLQDWTVVVIFMVVIGGIGTIEGPILGLLIYFGLRQLLADYGSWYLIVMGCVAVLFMLRMREGLWGWVQARFDIQLFPVRRHY
jgi:branched-chain amino acid transport system permease protein